MAIIQQINTNLLDPRQYSFKDAKVIGEYPITSEFDSQTDTVEYYIYDINKRLISYTPEFTQYKVIDPSINQEGLSTINIDVEETLVKRGIDLGTYEVVFNFFRNELDSSFRRNFFIKEVSSNRTELRLASNFLTNEELKNQINSFVESNSSKDYFPDFIVNFGENRQYIANNILLDETDPNNFSFLIKLYSPLPVQFETNDQLWIAKEVADPRAFKVTFESEEITLNNAIPLRGPDFNVGIKNQSANSTQLQSINDLLGTGTGSLNTYFNGGLISSSYDQLQNILSKKGINISTDFTKFDNFVHFSSAEQRLSNFYYKVGLIESASTQISQSLLITSSYTASNDYSSSIENLQLTITDTVKTFDSYENFLYYSSESLAWPKSTTTAPYTLRGTGSAQVLTWYGSTVGETGLIFSASLYDEENQDNLIYTIPEYLREDSSNKPYELFIEMMGQYFDELYLYTNDITNKHDADNRLNVGVSKDIVGDVLKSFGIKLYENNFSSEDIYASLLGINNNGGLVPPTGDELILNYISASNDPIPVDDVNKEIYKRIYHNMPYLLKKKGTVEGLRTLINTFGIPSTLLKVNEFGGKTINSGYDYYKNVFNYGFTGTNLVTDFTLKSSFGNNEPNGVFFRFKYISGALPANDTAFIIASSSGAETTLTYKGGAGVSASFSGSIVSASEFSGEITLGTARVSGSLFNGEWWNVGLSNRAAVKVFIGNNSNVETDGFNSGYITSSVGNATLTGNQFQVNHNGSKFALQEIKFFSSQFTDQGFKNLVMNPYTLVNDPTKDSKNSLAFRAPGGAELEITRSAADTNFISFHPAVTGSAITTSFALDNSDYIYNPNAATYLPQTQSIYYTQPYVGLKNKVSEKIKLTSYDIPSGTLSPFRSVIQDSEYGNGYNNPYGRDINKTEVVFSPTNQIDDDIISSVSQFDIGSLIGDPVFLTNGAESYLSLNNTRDNYFKKYYKAYEWRDYVRLIKYFDNSLFKMIEDFSPAKSSVTTGVVIKQHLLERNKYPTPQVTSSSPSHPYLYEGSGSLTGNILIMSPSGSEHSASGGTGGSFLTTASAFSTTVFNQNQSFTVFGLNGPNTITSNNPIAPRSSEFYDGELRVRDGGRAAAGGNVRSDAVLATNQVASQSITKPLPVHASDTTRAFVGSSTIGFFSYEKSAIVTGVDTFFETQIASRQVTAAAQFAKSIHFIRSSNYNVGVTRMVIGFSTGSNQEFSSSMDKLVRGNKFNISFTQSPYAGAQPINIPYEFTVGSIIKNLNTGYGTAYYDLSFAGDQPSPSEPSYIFNYSQVNASTGAPDTGTNGTSYGASLDGKIFIPNFTINDDNKVRNITPQAAAILREEANPLANSIVNNRTSVNYEEISYGNGIVTPVNINLIQQGTANRAQVQDSNYTNTGHVNARYEGTRVTSPDFNIRSKVN